MYYGAGNIIKLIYCNDMPYNMISIAYEVRKHALLLLLLNCKLGPYMLRPGLTSFKVGSGIKSAWSFHVEMCLIEP